jgi:hypothetical protein
VSAELQALVASAKYKPGWKFCLTQGPTVNPAASFLAGDLADGYTRGQGRDFLSRGVPLFLHVVLRAPDSGNPAHMIRLAHLFAVPDAHLAIPWDHWLFDRVMDVERHEAMEAFETGGRKPFYPQHGTPDVYRMVRTPEPPQVTALLEQLGALVPQVSYKDWDLKVIQAPQPGVALSHVRPAALGHSVRTQHLFTLGAPPEESLENWLMRRAGDAALWETVNRR